MPTRMRQLSASSTVACPNSYQKRIAPAGGWPSRTPVISWAAGVPGGPGGPLGWTTTVGGCCAGWTVTSACAGCCTVTIGDPVAGWMMTWGTGLPNGAHRHDHEAGLLGEGADDNHALPEHDALVVAGR